MRSDEATGKEPPLQGHREKWTRLTGQLKSGDHLCAIYETPEQLWATMVPLLRDGLAKNEKVVYIVAHHTATEILDMLTTAGVPAHDTLRTGQLEIFSWDDTYLAGGYFNPDQVIETFRKLEADSLAAGWSALRVTGEMTWVLSKPPEVERLIEYEAKLNHFFPGSRTLAICQYWEEKFDARILLDVIRTHPIVIAGDIVCENLFYEPPDEFLAVTDAPVPRAAYRRRLAGIRDRARTLEALRQERDFNRTLIHASPAFFVAIDAAGKTLLMNDTMLRALGYAGDEVVGTDYLTTFVPEGDRAELAQVFTRLTSLGQPTVNENRVRAKDGREFLVEWHGRSMLKEDGTLDCFFGVGIDITARRKTEEELRRVNRALQVLSQCSEAVIQAAEEEPLLEEICRIVVETGGYRWAWIGVIGEDAEKAVLPIAQAGVDEGYVKTLGVTWADAAHGRGLTRTALRTGKPAVARDILTDPRFGPWQEEATRRGYASSAALPLIAEGQTLGILNVYAAEPDAFSDEEVALLMRLATVVAYGMAALHARAARDLAEAQLRHRAKLEQAITQISTRFTTLAPQEVDREIARALQEIGTFAQADRSHVFQFSPDGEYMVNTHDWCAPGIEPPLQHLQALPVEAYPWWMGRLRRGELIHVPRVRELPEEARAERELLLAQGTQSVLAVPVAVGTSLIGFLRVDSVRAEKGWPQDAVTLLGIVGEVIAGALHRKRTEEALRESKERYRGLFEDAPVALLEEDFSQVKQAVDELRARGITDFRAYLDAHPEVVADWAARVKILRFNKAVLDLFGAKSGEEIQALHAQAAGEVLDTSREEFIALAEGKTGLNQDGIALDLAGNRHTVRVQLTVPPGARERWDRVLLSLTDVTEQMRLRQQLQRQVQQLEALRQLDLTITGILDLRMTLDVLLDQVVRGLGADAADVLLVNPQHQTLEFAAAHGLRSGAL
ncbi:MEDS domain-containing protein, partial [Candidatus Bipolaricaulota bacterium]|nr:MEDS domain-containing protein [Candidatus Bipolaricaulota bacterium]